MVFSKESAIQLRESGVKYKDICVALGCTIDWCKRNLKGIEGWRVKTSKWRKGGMSGRLRRAAGEDKPKGYYVYFGVIDEEVLYVGMGTGYRYLHVCSGCSHCYELNLQHFMGKVIHVHIVYEGLSREEAVALEAAEIDRIQPSYNKQQKDYSMRGN